MVHTRLITSTPAPSVFYNDGMMAQQTTTGALRWPLTCRGNTQAAAPHSPKGWAIPMITMTEEMRDLIDNAIANGTPCILATATKTGVPHMSFRGSMMVLDDASLAYWDRVKRQSLQHITENPHVCVLFRHPPKRIIWHAHR
jgi:pyridoxamine 5'-phosphate oxidase-like protein